MAPKKKLVQLNVRIPRELMRRVVAASGARDEKLGTWVAGVLDLRTKGLKDGVEAIRQHDEMIEEKQSKLNP